MHTDITISRGAGVNPISTQALGVVKRPVLAASCRFLETLVHLDWYIDCAQVTRSFRICVDATRNVHSHVARALTLADADLAC